MKRFKFITLASAVIVLASGCSKTEQGNQTAENTPADTVASDTMAYNETSAPATESAVQTDEEAKETPQASALNFKSLIDAVYAQKKSVFYISGRDVEAFMNKLGFTLEGKSNTTISDDFGDMDVVRMSFKNGTETAVVYVDRDGNGLRRFEFKFPDKGAANEMVAASKKAMGKKLKSEYGGFLYLYKNIEYWMMEQKGKTITINVEENTDGGESY